MTDDNIKVLGHGSSIMRDRYQTGKQMPVIQYAPKLSTQTQRQQVLTQTRNF
jgi:hypothetical protein